MAAVYDEEAAVPLASGKQSVKPHVVSFDGRVSKQWRGGLCNCFAGCDQIAWAACALTQAVPCVAFG